MFIGALRRSSRYRVLNGSSLLSSPSVYNSIRWSHRNLDHGCTSHCADSRLYSSACTAMRSAGYRRAIPIAATMRKEAMSTPSTPPPSSSSSSSKTSDRNQATSSIRGLMSALNKDPEASVAASRNVAKSQNAANALFSPRVASKANTATGASSTGNVSLSSLLNMSKTININKAKETSSQGGSISNKQTNNNNNTNNESQNLVKKKFSFNISPTANLLDVLISKRANNQHSNVATTKPINPTSGRGDAGLFKPLPNRDGSTGSTSKRNDFFVLGDKVDRDMADKLSGSKRGDSSNKTRLNGHVFKSGTMQAAAAIQDEVGTGSAADEIDADGDDPNAEPLTAGEIRYRQHQQHLERKKKGFFRKYDIEEEQEIIIAPLVGDEMLSDTGFITNNESMDISDIKKKMEIQLRLKKQEQERKNAAKVKKASSSIITTNAQKPIKSTIKEVEIPADGLELRQLASSLSMKVNDLVAKLEELGELDGVIRQSSKANTKDNSKKKKKSKNKVNKVSLLDSDGGKLEERQIDADVIELIVLEMGITPKRVSSRSMQSQIDRLAVAPSAAAHIDGTSLTERSPVVCIMGHVDHGKTTLLDTLRKANVAGGEAGGITQKLSAFTVTMNGRRVVFLDTPGHAAFNSMRANGAAATDLVVLVIDINDGVRPQTKEAIQMAISSNCSTIIALNKIDKVPADERIAARSRVLGEVNQCGLVAEDFGGDTLVVEVAGKTGEGVDNLIESLLLQADVMELRARPEGYCEATVLDSYREKERGVVCDVLVGWGELSIGDDIVVGTAFGRVRAMYDDTGAAIESAGPSTPVRVIGLRDVPLAGQELISVEDEDRAKEIAERRLRYKELKDLKIAQSKSASEKAALAAIPLDENGNPILPTKSQDQVINIILKADCAGTIEALENVVRGVSDRVNEVEIKIMGSSIGDVTPNDLDRATTIGGETAIFCFNTGISDFSTRALSKELDVKVYSDTVIYRLEEELISRIEKKLPTEKVLSLEGAGKVLQIFNLKDKSNTTVGGISVVSGTLRHSGDKYIYKVKRDGAYVTPDNGSTVSVLKRFKDTVHEVQQGNECGLVLDHWKDYEVGDEVECYKIELKQKKLVMNEFKQ